jgi:aspartyl-tRNA(Asn)/glutamyl-tRNA(Gln) amidotransferase subunit B
MAMIGLEIHAYLDTKEKLFCSCNAVHGAKEVESNTNICPICTAQPGSKPMLPNFKAVKKAIQVGLILGCKINEKMPWQRKHYSWPDLPKGFQNTLSGPHSIPNAVEGNFEGIKILECHLEEDPAAWDPVSGKIDYNRCGVPLIEIVTAPDFKTSEEVEKWLYNLKTTLSYIKAIDSKAGLKADVNVSLPEKKGVRIEIKNVNSIQNIKKVIDIEIARQEKEVPKEQETRRFDEANLTTTKMRSKENAQDYRFISDPDLPCLVLEKKLIENIKKELPLTPKQKLEQLIKKYKIEKKHAQIFVKELEIVDLFEKIVEKTDSKLAIRFISEELLSVLNYNKIKLEEIDLNPKHFISLLNSISEGKINELKAKEILRSWKEKSFDPKEKINENSQISDEGELNKSIEKVLKENEKAVLDYKSGEVKVINFLIGKVMQETDKRADFKVVKEMIEKVLKN